MYVYSQVETRHGNQVGIPVTVQSDVELPLLEEGYRDPDTGIWINTIERMLVSN